MLYPVSAQAKPTMPRLGDAVQRWLRHPEPSSWSYNSTIIEKFLYVSSLSEFFSLVRKERKGQKEESIPLLNTFCRLAATSANKVPRPSNYSIATATGSKRSSADSDLLLCHVRLWRTSRFKFGCASVCEHSKIRVILAIQNIVTPHPSRYARHLLPQEKAGKTAFASPARA